MVLTEWEEFKTLDFEAIYQSMQKPAFLFDGRNLLDRELTRRIGFEVHNIGKSLIDGVAAVIQGMIVWNSVMERRYPIGTRILPFVREK